MTVRLHLRDLSGTLVSAWREAFEGVADVTITRGDIFSTKPGIIDNTDPIDVRSAQASRRPWGACRPGGVLTR